MASSNQLSENTNQHAVKNSISSGREKMLALSVVNAVDKIVSEYPNIQFMLYTNVKNHISSFKKQSNLTISLDKLTNDILLAKQKRIFPDIQFDKTAEPGFINPDGSILFAKFNGVWKMVCISEHKHQGTNDKRIAEGKPKQAKGNAIERFGKNLSVVRTFMKDENITPYILFADGCDFEKTSSIRGRLWQMNECFGFNQIYVLAKANGYLRPISMFVRKEEWSELEMRNLLYAVCKESLDYYNKKYNINNTDLV